MTAVPKLAAPAAVDRSFCSINRCKTCIRFNIRTDCSCSCAFATSASARASCPICAQRPKAVIQGAISRVRAGLLFASFSSPAANTIRSNSSFSVCMSSACQLPDWVYCFTKRSAVGRMHSDSALGKCASPVADEWRQKQAKASAASGSRLRRPSCQEASAS